MAKVIEIRTCDDLDNPAEWTEVGNCSNCGKLLIYQQEYGFPIRCPYCEASLENGTDDRPSIKDIYIKKSSPKARESLISS